jgi:hypothetical protein
VLPATAASHYRQQQALAVQTAARVSALWATVGDDFDLGWSRIGAAVFAAVIAGQTQAAADGLAYVPAVLAEQGIAPDAVEQIDPNRFAGGTSEGAPVEYLLGATPIKAKVAMGDVPNTGLALKSAETWLTTITLDAIRDANRDATAAQMGVTPAAEGWVRMLNPPSCRRCLPLAGKFYRWNQGFLRHPKCDCRHIPSKEALAGDLTVDPYAYFHSLDKPAQDRMFGKADAQAIRDGADIYRVSNVRMRGLANTKGRAGWQARRYGSPSKMTIDDVYAAAGDDRAKAIRLMRENGFIVDGGQTAGGAILGNVPNDLAAGKLGRGGTRKGATLAYRKAIRTGERDPLEPATQTAAERRLHSAFLMKQAVDRGSNPFAGNSARNPLTPQIRELVQRNYDRQIAALENGPEQVRTLARLLGIRVPDAQGVRG